jgi:hypothetical protein
MKKLFLAIALAFSTFASPAFAGQQDFTIINRTGQAIMTLNVSPSDETSWGPDILGVDILAAGEQSEISFDRDEERCNWDIRVTYEDGDTGDWRQVNLCETTTVTLS